MRSTVDDHFTDQRPFDVRCEWGSAGVAALASCRTFVVVDVLSFSTCMSIASSRGVEVFPCRSKGAEASELAASVGAVIAGPRGDRYSLSPASLAAAPAGLRLVLTSANGAVVTLDAAARGRVLAGCLRNRSAVAARAAELGGPIALIAAGERWSDGGLRPAFEDLVGVGAIAAALPGRAGTRSPEVDAAVAAFEGAATRLRASLLTCSSGRELIERGFESDVHLAAELDVEATAAEFVDGRFVRSGGEASP